MRTLLWPLLPACMLMLGARGAADTLVFYEIAPLDPGDRDIDLYAQKLTPEGELAWGTENEPKPLAISTQIETAPAACTDGAGGAIVVYAIEFTEGENEGDIDLVAQRIDGEGQLVWNDGESPQPVATSRGRETGAVVVSDGEGGAFVVYEWLQDGTDSDILAQRIGPDGKAMWNEGERPAILAASEAVERHPVVVPDGEGGIIVVFEWENAEGNVDVMAQRVTADGTVLWDEGNQAIDVSDSDHLERAPVAVPDGEGGAIVAFELEFTDGKYKGDVDIMAQRISADGERLWNEGTEPAAVSSGKGIERNPSAVADGAGGVIVAFEYEPLEGEYAGDVDILAQRLDGAGNMLWEEGKRSVVVSSSPQLERAVQTVPDGEGGLLAVFEHEFRGGEQGGDVDIFAQRLRGDGTLAWAKGERSIMAAASQWLERAPIAVSDGDGGLVLVFTAVGPEGKFEGDEDIRAARISGTGELLWHEGERVTPVSATQLLERNPCVVATGP